VDQFRDAFKTLCTKASTVTTPDAEKKNLWPRALEAHRALPPVDPKQFITLWGKGPLKAFEGCAQRAQIGGGVQGLPEAHVRVHGRDLPEAILPRSSRAAEDKDYPASCVGMLNGDLHDFLLSRLPAARSEFAKKSVASASTPATKGASAVNMALLDKGDF